MKYVVRVKVCHDKSDDVLRYILDGSSYLYALVQGKGRNAVITTGPFSKNTMRFEALEEAEACRLELSKHHQLGVFEAEIATEEDAEVEAMSVMLR